jgi:hypothetical protein
MNKFTNYFCWNNIVVNDTSDTNYDYITDKQCLNFMKKNMLSFFNLIKEIHFNPDHPENHNIYVPDYKTSIIKYKKDGIWFVADANEFINDLIYDYHYRFFIKFEDDPKTVNIFKTYIKITESTDDQNKIKKELFYLMHNYRHLCNE